MRLQHLSHRLPALTHEHFEILIDVPSCEHRLEACSRNIAFDCGVMNQRPFVELRVVPIDIRGSLLPSNTKPLD